MFKNPLSAVHAYGTSILSWYSSLYNMEKEKYILCTSFHYFLFTSTHNYKFPRQFPL